METSSVEWAMRATHAKVVPSDLKNPDQKLKPQSHRPPGLKFRPIWGQIRFGSWMVCHGPGHHPGNFRLFKIAGTVQENISVREVPQWHC